MDVKIQKRNPKYKILVWSAGAVALLAALILLILNSRSVYETSVSTVLVDTVRAGTYTDQLSVNATLASLHSFILNVPEGGTVARLMAEDGQMVKAGDVLLQLNNPAAQIANLSQQAGVEQQINQVRASELDLQNQAIALQKELISAQSDYNLAAQDLARQQRLLADEIGRRADFDRATETFKYQKQRLAIIKGNIRQNAALRPVQTQSLNRSLTQLRQSGAALAQNNQSLTVRAAATGRLTGFTPQVGQTLTSGQSIGKIDLLDGYKLIANIDQYYLGKLSAGVSGTAQTSNADAPVYISKILPEIKNGQFTAEVQYKGKAPSDARLGMNSVITLILSEPRQSILLPKGDFFKESAGKWVYVLNNANLATKRTVKLGRENNQYYEVLSGLRPGDRVITSDYHDYLKYNQIQLTN